MKGPRGLLRKSNLESKDRMCKSQRAADRKQFPCLGWCMSVSTCEEGEKDLVNTYRSSTRGSKVTLLFVRLCVSSVRWGQRSQPADASGGSQDGCSQTLIRETHRAAFPVFTALQTFPHRHGVDKLPSSNPSHLLLVTKVSIKNISPLIIFTASQTCRAKVIFLQPFHKRTSQRCVSVCVCMCVCRLCFYVRGGNRDTMEKCVHVSSRPSWHTSARRTLLLLCVQQHTATAGIPAVRCRRRKGDGKEMLFGKFNSREFCKS